LDNFGNVQAKVYKIQIHIKIITPMKKIRFIIKLLCLIFLMYSCTSDMHDASVYSIIPAPASMENQNGRFILNQSVSIFCDDELKATADYLARKLEEYFGIKSRLIISKDQSSAKKGINLQRDTLLNDLGTEGYRMVVSARNIKVSAKSQAGVFYGIQSLFQLIGQDKSDRNSRYSIPAVVISDYPAFHWRGMHLDVARHFESREFIKKYLDILAAYKLNVFHWHLTDDQGWRIEIEKYPLLTEIGAFRVDRTDEPWDYDQEVTNRMDAKLYGGFYTKEDIREIVDYASELHITIVPEIEMPGHSQAAMTAYPQLSCSGKPYRRPVNLPFEFTDPFCAGNDSTFIFLEDVLKEVMALFPSEYIHVGGDEAKKTPWLTCEKCKALMKREKISNVDELQSYFIRRIENLLQVNGRKLIGWDEILEGGLAEGAAVMSWRGEEGGIEAASMGHNVVMVPWKYLYFNAYQDSVEAKSTRDDYILDMEEVYRYNPIPGALNADEQKFIIGVQACLWSENIQTPEQAEHYTLPRLCALSEIGWTHADRKDWDNFQERLNHNNLYLDRLGVNYYKPAGK
jgi:hexosaminidase